MFTLSVVHLPGSTEVIVLSKLVLTPSMQSGGGSLFLG